MQHSLHLLAAAHWPLVALWGVLLAFSLREFRAHRLFRAQRALLAVAAGVGLLEMAEHAYLGILTMAMPPDPLARQEGVWADPMFILNLLSGIAVLPLLAILFRGVVPALRREQRAHAQRHRALRKEREFKFAVLEALQALVVVLDEKGRITSFNRYCEELTGRHADEVRGRLLWDAMLCPTGAERLAAMFRDACTVPGRPRRIESQWTAHDGTPRVIAWSSCALTPGDRTKAVVATGIDITGERRAIEELEHAYDGLERLVGMRTAELEQANAALRHSRQRLAEAQRSAHIGSWELEARTRRLHWSDEVFRIFGLQPSDTGQAAFTEFWGRVHPEDRAELGCAFDAALVGGSPIDVDHRIIRPDGSERIVHSQAHVVLDAGAVPQRLIGTIQDITTRHHAQAALERAHEELERRVEERTAALRSANRSLGFTQFAVDNAGDAVFWLAQDGRILYVNDVARQHLGYSRRQLLKMSASDFARDYGTLGTWADVLSHLRRHRRAVYESIYTRHDGSSLPVEVAASYLEYENQEYVCAFVRDISQRRQMEALLQRRHEAEKKVFQIASRFVNTETASALQTALEDLGLLTGARCVCMMRLCGDRGFEKQAVWCAAENSLCHDCRLDVSAMAALDESLAMLSSGRLVFFSDGAGPFDTPRGAEMCVLVPMFSADALSAVIALDGVQHGGGVDHDDFTLVQIAVKSMGNAVARHEAELRTHDLLDENRRLVRQSITAQEQERAYLARELHDEMGQSLTAIRADAGTIARLSRNSDDTRIHESARAIVDVSTRVYQVVHKLMLRMRPEVLDSLGLAEAVRELVEEWRGRRPDLAWTLRTTGVPEKIPGNIAINAYRIVQECVTNVMKHAEAHMVTISLAEQVRDGCRCLEIDVTDDGQGLEPSGDPRGTGLAGMRERALSANGEFEVRSRLGGGTTVIARLPLNNSK
jgi:PAS domain S-box-containing protein